MLQLLAAALSACEPWCVEPCNRLSGDPLAIAEECGDCDNAAFLCRRGSPGFPVDGSSMTTSFDVDGWRRCLPSGSDIPHAHDHINTNHDSRRFDMRCLLAHHTSYFGDAYIPRLSLFGLVSLPPSQGCERAQGHLQSFGHQRQRQRHVTEVHGCLDSPTFINDFVRSQRPVLMRGCAHAHPASELWAKDAYLAATAGDWMDDTLGHFAEWLATYTETNEYHARMLDDMREDAPRHRALLADLALPPPLIDAAEHLAHHSQTIFWMNAGRRTSGLHFDSHDAFLQQLGGQKEVLLVAPTESHMLYADFPMHPPTRAPSRDADHGVASSDDHNTNDDNSADDGHLDYARFGYSPVNVHAVDLCAFPRAADVSVYNVSLHHGDSLYIPPVWWHVVASLPRASAGRTVATTLQGFFDAAEVPNDMSVAALQWRLARARGCAVGELHHESPSTAAEQGAEGTGPCVGRTRARDLRREAVESAWVRSLRVAKWCGAQVPHLALRCLRAAARAHTRGTVAWNATVRTCVEELAEGR
jgi:hypothetical protein